jgi:hypothetical protein
MATEVCQKGCVNKCDAVHTVHACAQLVIFVSFTGLL